MEACAVAGIYSKKIEIVSFFRILVMLYRKKEFCFVVGAVGEGLFILMKGLMG
jgi:hypothetical protein